ncbi:MAG TPA: FAD/NAD(P)-binding protein [Thermoleophilaceae bacterium]|nr:FAD/NAD(P)-binding protein [Thermoleophilaceae bacterium]
MGAPLILGAIETDYLIVGAGATGLAFADTLVAEDAEVEVTVVDRRPASGGHWLDAYPFVRLHSPSAYYGVGSLPLGEDRIDRDGENARFYERATGAEVRDYFAEVAARLERSGRVRLLSEHEHLDQDGDAERVRDLGTGELHDVAVRRSVVDARYLEASVPSTHIRSFEVVAGTRVVPLNDLPEIAESASCYAVLGSGKTAVDACTWLLDNGVEADRIRWVRPRDAWFDDRAYFQPLDLVGKIMEGIALDTEAGAQATDLDDLFDRLEASGRLWRIDPSQPATMYRGTMLSARELEAVRQIEDVVRLGHVRRVEADRILLERGEVDTGPGVLHVDCTALGLRNAPATPIFQPGRIVLQQVRHNSPSFNAALLAFVEAHRDDDDAKNRLCPPNPYSSGIADWPRMMTRTWRTERRWLNEPDLAAWLVESRLNLLGALPAHAGERSVRSAVERYLANVGPAIERLARLDERSAS